MTNNFIAKLLSSIPIILIVIYFLPFLGFCLLIFRSLIYSKKKISTSLILIIIGILLLVPKFLNFIFNILSFDINTIPYYNEIINSNIYNINIVNYSKSLIMIGIIYLLISMIFTTIFNRASSSIKNYIARSEEKDYEIKSKNNLVIQEKQEKAKNTTVVICPNCGADNIFTEKIGRCKYCRQAIESKK